MVSLKLLTVCVLAASVMALAGQDIDQLPVNTSSASAEKTGPLSNLSLQTGFEFSQNTAEDEQAKRAESMDLVIVAGYKISESLKASLRTILTKENKEGQQTQASDTRLNLSIRGFELSPSVSTLHSVYGVIPTSQKSKEVDRLQTALGFTNGLHYAGPILDVKYRLGYAQFFHEYNVNADGSANIQHSLSNSLDVEVRFTEKFYLSSTGIYRLGQTYGRKERSSFEIHGDLNYDINSKVAVNLGTSNAGQALKANGVDSNMTAFDKDSSVIRAGISIVL